jgi:hypothetical protein
MVIISEVDSSTLGWSKVRGASHGMFAELPTPKFPVQARYNAMLKLDEGLFDKLVGREKRLDQTLPVCLSQSTWSCSREILSKPYKFVYYKSQPCILHNRLVLLECSRG